MKPDGSYKYLDSSRRLESRYLKFKIITGGPMGGLFRYETGKSIFLGCVGSFSGITVPETWLLHLAARKDRLINIDSAKMSKKLVQAC